MSDPVASIQSLLDNLRRRERRLLLARAGLMGVIVLCAGWLGLAAGLSGGLVNRNLAWGWVGLVVVGAGALAWPALRRWRQAHAREQAVRVEELRPELRGALLTVLDRAQRPMGSPALLARLAANTAQAIAAIPAEEVWPTRPVQKLARVALLVTLLLAFGGLVLPRGPLEALLWLTGASAKVMTPTAAVPDGPRVLVGDITLRYLYPTYTGLSPVEVSNSNGEIHAPPGTVVQISARTAEPQDGAALQINELEPVPVERHEERDLAASFTVTDNGVWRFLFTGGRSPDYRIVVEPDLPPDVSLSTQSRALSVGVDAPIRLPYVARDDYGLRKVVIEIKDENGVRSIPLREPLDTPRTLGDPILKTPTELGISAGKVVKMRVGAYDNDAIAGSKAGWSAWIDLDVLGPNGTSARLFTWRQSMRDALVRTLADFLVEPAPIASDRVTLRTWKEDANKRFDAFDQLVQEARSSIGGSFDESVVKFVNDSRRDLLSFAHGLAVGEGSIAETDLSQLAALQAKNIDAIEQGILLLDMVLRAAATEQVRRTAQEVAREAQELAADAKNLDQQAMLARLDQLQRLMQKLAAEAAKLEQGSLQEWVNSRQQESMALMDEIRKAIAEGRLEDARKMMEQLAQQLNEMAQGIEDMQQRGQQESDETQQAMAEMKNTLEQLKKDQEALREKTEDAREKFGQDMDEAVKLWEEVERLSGEVAGDLARIEQTINQHIPSLSNSIEGVRADADGLYDSARARDLQTSLERVGVLSSTLNGLQIRAQRAMSPQGAPVAALLASQLKKVKEIEKLLEQMQSEQMSSSPQLQQQLQQLAQQQQDLQQRMEQASQQAQELGQELPLGAPGLGEGTQEASEQAQRATEAMRQGDPMGAEGGQQAAEDGLERALEALEDAQRNMQQMQQASGQGGQEERKEGQEGDKTGDGQDYSREEVIFPEPEEFQTPEAYRRALLEGMSSAVPEEYKQLNHQYYEELVRQ